jgi:hypothetical protein
MSLTHIRFASLSALALIQLASAQGDARGWGLNADSQSVVPPGLGAVRFVTGGSFHSVAVRADGTVVAWGRNDYGQCNVPSDLANVTRVASAGEHTLALLADFTVRAWGRNDYGQAGTPADVEVCSAIAAGNAHNVVIKADGTIRCWGYNSDGECDVPAGIGAVSTIAAGGYHSAALRSDGSVACWGYNGFGECNVPSDLPTASQVSASGFHTAVILTDGTVRCWGRNDYGQCTVPTLSGTPVELATGSLHTGVRYADGRVQLWGSNDAGQCDVPKDIGVVSQLVAGGSHTLAIESAPLCRPHPAAVRWSPREGGNGHWYARNEAPLPWSESRRAAESLGGHLATPTTAEENAFITPMLDATQLNVHHLGGLRAGKNWQWITGEPWSYTNWYPGEPNNATGNEIYLASWVIPGTWNDVYPEYAAPSIIEWELFDGTDCDGNGDCDFAEISTTPGLDLNRDTVLDRCQCIADVVVDGSVDAVDLARVINDWGLTQSAADIDADGVVAASDLAIILASWGTCTP